MRPRAGHQPLGAPPVPALDVSRVHDRFPRHPLTRSRRAGGHLGLPVPGPPSRLDPCRAAAGASTRENDRVNDPDAPAPPAPPVPATPVASPSPTAAPIPQVGIIMGSRSDWETMRHAAETLDRLGIPYEVRVISAHRTPDLLFAYAEQAEQRGLVAIVAGAGGAAHLPGMTAAKTLLPVIGVPVESASLKGLDSLLSIAQMPAGVPVGTMAIGRSGAVNAALLAARVVARLDPQVREAVAAFASEQTGEVLAHPDPRDEA